jgi:hypothetical protein
MVFEASLPETDGSGLQLASFAADGIDDRIRLDPVYETGVIFDPRQEDGQVMVIAEKVGQLFEIGFDWSEACGIKHVERLDLVTQVLGPLSPDV